MFVVRNIVVGIFVVGNYDILNLVTMTINNYRFEKRSFKNKILGILKNLPLLQNFEHITSTQIQTFCANFEQFFNMLVKQFRV